MKKANIPILRNFVGGMLFGLLIVAVMASTIGCSNHWRESDPGIDGAQAFELFDEISQSAGDTQSFSQTALNEVRDDQYATLYFAQSGGSMGQLASIFSFSDASFLGSLFGENIPIGSTVFDLQYGLGVTDVAVIFYDGVSTNGARYFTLMMKFMRGDETSYQIFQSAADDYSITDKEFETRMPVTGGTLILRSNDVSPDTDGELAGTIKLEAVFVESGSSYEYDIGQFSVLHGFGGTI